MGSVEKCDVQRKIRPTSCGDLNPSEGNPMSDPFVPSNIESLADVDPADVSYEKECVAIQGVVSPSGQGGWPGQEGNYKVHCFQFAAWHRLGEPVVKRDLTILRPVPRESNYFEDFPDYSIHRISVLLSTDETRAVFDRLLPLDEADEELVAVGEELRKPVIISTKTFGDLVLDRRHDWFEGRAKWHGKRIELHFHADHSGDPKSIDDALKTAEILWKNQSEWNRKVAAFAVKELLAVKNDNWLGDDETPLSARDFVGRMTLESISFDNRGKFEFWHDDGDLFWGHSIQVCGNLKDGLTDADIPG
jgi:hypothetical protein